MASSKQPTWSITRNNHISMSAFLSFFLFSYLDERTFERAGPALVNSPWPSLTPIAFRSDGKAPEYLKPAATPTTAFPRTKFDAAFPDKCSGISSPCQQTSEEASLLRKLPDVFISTRDFLKCGAKLSKINR